VFTGQIYRAPEFASHGRDAAHLVHQPQRTDHLSVPIWPFCAGALRAVRFSGREVTLLRRIAPHLGAGLKAAVLRSRVSAETNS
jgi:hypothetical protein